MIAVATTAIALAIIDGSLKPSGACRIYPNEINVHMIEGMKVMRYCFSFLIRYEVAANSTIVATINWDQAKYLHIKLKSINVRANATRPKGTPSFSLDIMCF